MRSPLLALSLLSLVAFAAPSRAQSFVVTVDDARLFEGAAVDAGVITELPFDTVAELIGCRVSWCEVRLDGVRGFVQQQAVTPTDRRPARLPASALEERGTAEGVASGERVVKRKKAASAPIPPPAPAALPPAPAPEAALPPARTSTPPTVAPPVAAEPDRVTAPTPPATPAPSSPRPTTPGLKNPATGTLASLFLPGGGHLYAGERGAGALLLLLSAGAPTVGYLASDRTADPDCVSPGPGVACTDTTDYGPLFVGIAVASVAWVAGLLDAKGAVRRANERVANGRTAADVSVRPVAEAGYAGLSLRVTL